MNKNTGCGLELFSTNFLDDIVYTINFIIVYHDKGKFGYNFSNMSKLPDHMWLSRLKLELFKAKKCCVFLAESCGNRLKISLRQKTKQLFFLHRVQVLTCSATYEVTL